MGIKYSRRGDRKLWRSSRWHWMYWRQGVVQRKAQCHSWRQGVVPTMHGVTVGAKAWCRTMRSVTVGLAPRRGAALCAVSQLGWRHGVVPHNARCHSWVGAKAWCRTMRGVTVGTEEHFWESCPNEKIMTLTFFLRYYYLYSCVSKRSIALPRYSAIFGPLAH